MSEPGPDGVQGVMLVLMNTVDKIREKNPGLPWTTIIGGMANAQCEVQAQFFEDRARQLDEREEAQRSKIQIATQLPKP